MKYSSLVPLLTVLLASYGPCEQPSDFEEDCAGEGLLTAGVRAFDLRAHRRDVPRINLRSAKFDVPQLIPWMTQVKYHPAMDLLLATGFLATLEAVSYLIGRVKVLSARYVPYDVKGFGGLLHHAARGYGFRDRPRDAADLIREASNLTMGHDALLQAGVGRRASATRTA